MLKQVLGVDTLRHVCKVRQVNLLLLLISCIWGMYSMLEQG